MKRIILLIVLLLLMLGLLAGGGYFLVDWLKNRNAVGEDQGPQAASTQAAAVRLAIRSDLPALEKADRVVVEYVRPKEGNVHEVIVAPEAIEEIRQALMPRKVEPSAGRNAYQLSFYQGDSLIRKVWVFGDGEWGFQRPSGASWTTGENPNLVTVLRKYVK